MNLDPNVSPQAPSHADLADWDRSFVWHGFTQMAEYEPLIIDRAEGCRLIDIHGRALVDGVSSLWCNVHGHRHPRLDQAIREQLERVAHVTGLGMSNPTTIRLAKRLVELSPPGLSHVFFSDDGSTAVEAALKIAFQYWRQCPQPRPEKKRYVSFYQGYHGDTLGGVSVGGVGHFHELFQPLVFEPLRMPSPDTYRLPAGVTRDDATQYYLDQLAEVLQERSAEIAAVVLEPLVQGAAGIVVQPEGFLRGVRELASNYNVLLIADEVAVGMGRTGKMFACEHEAVTPDLLCLAKGLTGGYLPLAATLATDEVYRAFLGRHDELRTFFHGHTFGGNPLGAAVALANLEVFVTEETLARLPPKIERLGNHLQRIAELPFVGDARQRGMMAGIELVADKQTKEPFPWEAKRGISVCRRALEHGVWVRPLGNVIVIMPPLAIEPAELDQIGEAVEEAIREEFSI